MKYALIASDFDGTIYTSDYHIADGTREAIADYEKAGGIMMVSTGRLYNSVKKQLPKLGLDSGAVIVEQGASIVDVATGKVIRSYDIDSKLAYSCLRRMESYDKYIPMIYYKGDCYAPRRDRIVDFFETIIDVKINYVDMPISEFVSKNNLAPSKLLAICYPGKQGNESDDWAQEFAGLSFAKSNELLIEVVNSSAGKGNALKYVAEEIYHLDRESVIAMGDAENDLSMIEYAGLGVAMGNAMDIVKKRADIVADTNDNSGVAQVIRKYGIGEEL